MSVDVTVEASFGYGPGDDTPVFTDITSYVRSMQWQRGRQNELNQTQAGTGQLVLADPDSHWDPDNGDSPFYPYVKPGVTIRAVLTVGASSYPLFYHYIERLPRTARVSDVYTEREVDLIDGFAVLNSAPLSGDTYSSQVTDERVTDVLDNIQWAASRRNIGTGSTTISGVTFANDDRTKAQAHLLQVTDTENGFIFCDGSGDIVFIGREQLFTDPAYTTSLATFRDDGGSAGWPYQEIVPSYDLDNVFNRWTGTRDGGTPQTVGDADSKAAYFIREKQITSLATTDGAVLAQVQWKLEQFSQPLNRIESVTIMPLLDETDATRIDDSMREVADRITLLETPPGFASEQSVDYVIQQLSGSVTMGPLRSGMTLTFMLWPSSALSGFWLAGDSVLSLAGVTTKAGF